MGCINSRKNGNGDVFRARVSRLQPEISSISRNGFLELTRKELIFVPSGIASREPIVWQLLHLRRYGLNGDIFSFEAGRRCMSGPGIYAFRCHQNAEHLYHLFQRYVNAVSLVANEEIFNSRSYEHPSHTFGRPDANPHSNNYLEPAPVCNNIPLAVTHRLQALQESFSSSPLSLLDSPDSVPSLSFTNEMINFSNNNGSNHNPSTPGSASYANIVHSSNLYSENPQRPLSQTQKFFASANPNCNSLQRRPLIKHTSLDAPQECAPLPPPITPSVLGNEALHNYANVETPIGRKLNRLTTNRSLEKLLDSTERCYENLSRTDIPLLLQLPPIRYDDSSNNNKVAGDKSAQQPPPPPTTTPGGVNYIVLDLDQPRSPTQSSPKTCFGSGLSLGTGGERSENSLDIHSPPLTAGLSMSLIENDELQQPSNQQHHHHPSPHQQQQQQHQKSTEESSLGYSTIDFIKTCALIKSSTHGSDLDLDPEQDAEESRITRHSKCVRKAYSISE